MSLSEHGNLWLAETLWNLGGVQFGDFTLGRSTVHSPVHINLRLLISHPTALWRAAQVVLHEVQALQQMRHAPLAPFDLVAGVPFGGLHIATVFSLTAKIPMIYLHPRMDDLGKDIEGLYSPNQRVLIMDDLITGGGSILETALHLEECGLIARDAVVLLDRQQGGRERLQLEGINLTTILTLRTLLNYLRSNRRIPEDWYRKSIDFLDAQSYGELP